MPKKPPIKLVAHFTLSQLLKSLITRQIIAITILSDFNFYNNVAKPQKQKPVFPWKLGFIFRRFYGFFVSQRCLLFMSLLLRCSSFNFKGGQCFISQLNNFVYLPKYFAFGVGSGVGTWKCLGAAGRNANGGIQSQLGSQSSQIILKSLMMQTWRAVNQDFEKMIGWIVGV